jgi:general secretion pathway protein A
MYTSYFGFSRKPFNATPDPRFLYTNRCYQEAYATLLYGIQERKGFIALTGEVGTGKTTLLRRLMESMNPAIKVVFVYNTTLSFDELVEFICGELEIDVAGLARVARLQALNRFLIAEARQGGTVVLLLDEAQNLSAEALENLRLISNLETATDKLLQIVLVGQPELEVKLADPALRQVTQRLAIRFRLEPLDDAEVEPYIDYRLRVVGRSRKELFSDRAIRKLIPHVKGIPRLINVVCDNALVLAYATDRTRVSGQMMDVVLADLRLQLPASTPPPRTAAAGPREPAWREPAARVEAPPRRLWWAGVGVAAGSALALGAVALLGLGAPGQLRHLPTLAALGQGGARSSSTPAAPAQGAEPSASARADVETGPERATPAAVAPAEIADGDRPPAGRSEPADETPAPPAPVVTEPAPPRAAEPRARGTGLGKIAGRTLAVPRGGTISEIVFGHYGRYSSLALDLIHELNPGLRDVDVVAAGQSIWLPPLDEQALLRRQGDGSYRLVVGSYQSAGAAGQLARTIREHGYAATVRTRGIAAEQVLHRVEIGGLKTRAAALGAWETANRLQWFDVPTGR